MVMRGTMPRKRWSAVRRTVYDVDTFNKNDSDLALMPSSS